MARWWAIGLTLSLAAPAFAVTGAVNMTGNQERRMAHCPSTVPGAATRVTDRKDGVQVDVTSPNPMVQREIRKRAQFQANVSRQEQRGAIEHTGEGTGSAKFGYCPGMLQNTRIDVQELPNGARMTVHAASPIGVYTLQKETHSRLDRLQGKP